MISEGQLLRNGGGEGIKRGKKKKSRGKGKDVRIKVLRSEQKLIKGESILDHFPS